MTKNQVLERALMGCLLFVVMWVGMAAQAQAAPTLARGLIVRLKPAPQTASDSRVTPSALQVQAEQGTRLAKLAQRQGVPLGRHYPTGLGAHVLYDGRLLTLAQASQHARRLMRSGEVEWAIPNDVEPAHALPDAPDDTQYGQQAWLADSALGGLPNIPAAWRQFSTLAHEPSPVIVAVLDTGVLRHPDLSGRVLFEQGQDFVSELEYANDGDGMDGDASDPGSYLTEEMKLANPLAYQGCNAGHSSWHGTIIAGQLAAASDNQTGVSGMLRPLVGYQVLPVRVSGNCGAAVSDIIEGMLWAAGVRYQGLPKVNTNPARVLNLSFGGTDSCNCIKDSNGAPQTAGCLYQDAIRAITRKGAILVASSGNAQAADQNGSPSPARPANCPGVLAVTALRADGAKARYAYQVTAMGVATVGGSGDDSDEGIFSTSNSGAQQPVMDANDQAQAYYGARDGTSFASPIAAGTLALMWAVNPGLSVKELLDGLRNHGVRPHLQVSTSGTNLPLCSATETGLCNCSASTCGAGIVDTAQAVNWAASQPWRPYVALDVSIDTFSPERVVVSGKQQSTSSGGGAVEVLELVSLACITVLVGLISIGRTKASIWLSA